MTKYIMRLDDACEKRDIHNWDKIEELLDKYQIKPLVGVIPNCEDSEMDKYKYDSDFWLRVDNWITKGWSIAMHGYNHVYETDSGGINPVNARSEFAGLSLDKQRSKIRIAVDIFRSHNIDPEFFFAPSHTFDENTLIALKEESNIRTISDTVALDSYFYKDFFFIPLQSGRVRKLPLRTVTFCYHPNTMNEKDFDILNDFLNSNGHNFDVITNHLSRRKKTLIDDCLSKLYLKGRMLFR